MELMAALRLSIMPAGGGRRKVCSLCRDDFHRGHPDDYHPADGQCAGVGPERRLAGYPGGPAVPVHHGLTAVQTGQMGGSQDMIPRFPVSMAGFQA